MNELGAYIQEKRKEKGLSIRKLAELSGISHTEVKRIEDGLRKQTSPQVLRSIASALCVPYEELMAAAGYIDEPTSTETEGTTTVAGIKDAEDLSQDEIDQVNKYIAFLKSQRKE
ncbi:MAG: helix-turn-helix domain-containing protein [Phascolarctobacterium sp.]|nr:helix-turn-helix domain-containing protein [Phascolarctobacterium sp.]